MLDRNWDDLRHVLAAARARSLAGAARLLGVNQTTVARRIARAERDWGVRLFERTAGALVPTEAGATAVGEAERIERAMQAVDGRITGRDDLAAGSVRLTTVPIIANRILVPALPALARRHPALRIELIADPRDLSLSRREADIALRLARPSSDARALARRVGHLSYAVYAAREADAAGLAWLSYVDDMADLPQARWIAEQSRRDGAPPPALLANDAETLLRAVRAGLGKTLLPTVIGDRDPDLARVDDAPGAPSREMWLMVHPDLRELARIRVVIDWVAALAADFPT